MDLFPKNEYDVPQIFFKFKKLIEVQFNKKIKVLQFDGGGEFRSLAYFCQNNGIVHRLSCPYTSQQNGVVKRKHRHLVKTGLSLLAHTSMPLHFWDEAFSTAFYLIKRLPTAGLHGSIPLQKLYNIVPHYAFLRVFGCCCYPCLRS